MIYVRAALRRDGSDPVVPITSKDPTQVPVVARTTELWLVRHGLPQFMPHYGVRESLHVAVPLLIVIAGFAVASLPWLDLPAEQAPAAAPLLIAVAGCLVPLVRHVRHVLECYETPRSHLTIEVLGWIGALVAIIALYPAPPDIRPVYDAVWVDLVFVLVSLTAIAKLWRPAVRYKITTRLGLRKALLLWLVAGESSSRSREHRFSRHSTSSTACATYS